jgi:hypothetical protein
MTIELKIIMWMLLFYAVAYVTFFHGIPAIDEWERASGYPLGLHCEFWNVCKEIKK